MLAEIKEHTPSHFMIGICSWLPPPLRLRTASEPAGRLHLHSLFSKKPQYSMWLSLCREGLLIPGSCSQGWQLRLEWLACTSTGLLQVVNLGGHLS